MPTLSPDNEREICEYAKRLKAKHSELATFTLEVNSKSGYSKIAII